MTTEAQARSAEVQDTAHSAEGGPGTENAGERRERRSRDRYGRDRRERNQESRQDSASEEVTNPVAAASSDAAVTAQEAPDRPAARSYFERAQTSAAVAEAEPATPLAPAPALVESPENASAVRATDPSVSPSSQDPVAAMALAAPAPSEQLPEPTPAPKALPVAVTFSLPVDHLQQVAQSSGLNWVNSDPAKVAAVQAAIAAEPQAVRVPRERPPAVVLNEGPLVLVETRKDLNTLKVPF